MSRSTIPSIPDIIRTLAHEVFGDVPITKVNWGLSADLWRIGDTTPLGVIKQNRGFTSLATNELAALEFLSQHKFPAPRVLGQADSAFALEWMGANEGPAVFSASWIEPMADLVACLHSIDAEVAPIKLAGDPLPLATRLAKIATKAAGKLDDTVHRSLARKTLQSLDWAEFEPFPKRMTHRDLRAANFIVDARGRPTGLIDFEHAAATDPAWDFAKLLDWTLPESHTKSFLASYEQHRPAPHQDRIAVFRRFEALTQLSYFYDRNPDYRDHAAEILESMLS